MKTWSLFLGRRELLDTLGDVRPAKLPPVESDALNDIRPPMGPDEVCLLWDHDPRQGPWLPVSIAVEREEHLHDFLAWASTYLKGFSPFSAYFRVATLQTFLAASKAISNPDFDKHAASCVGAMVGEALTRQ